MSISVNFLDCNKAPPARSSVLCMTAATLLAVFSSTAVADRYELRLHDANVPGKFELLEGKVDRSIEVLEKALAGARAHSIRAPVLINLCAAYTIKGDFGRAKESCDAAIDNGWRKQMAYNNRGVMHIAQGDYVAAIDDFQRAASNRPSILVKRHLMQAKNRVEQLEPESRLAGLTSSVSDRLDTPVSIAE